MLSLSFNSDGTGTYTYFLEGVQYSVDFIWESTDSAIITSVTFDGETPYEWWVADYEFFDCDRLSLQIVWSDDTIENVNLVFERR